MAAVVISGTPIGHTNFEVVHNPTDTRGGCDVCHCRLVTPKVYHRDVEVARGHLRRVHTVCCHDCYKRRPKRSDSMMKSATVSDYIVSRMLGNK